MTTIFVSINGPGTVTDLNDGGLKAIKEAGYQVGKFDMVQDMVEDGIGVVGNLDIDDRLWEELERKGQIELTWGEYTVRAEMP